MNVVLLSGGSGTRLWPMSNDVRSKQFLKILRKEDGSRESMVQRMYRMIKDVEPDSSVIIAASHDQVSFIRNQLGNDISISVEPCRRDTFPAIALSIAYLHDELSVSEEEPVVICPVDSLVDHGYFETLKLMSDKAGEANLALMGIEPVYPSSMYGYIIPEAGGKVKEFKEKPDAITAERYISEGALWNGGVFAFKMSYMLNKVTELYGSCKYQMLFDKYSDLPKISFDYAVVEHETDINVIRYAGEWKDIGTWNTLTDAMIDEASGNVIMGENCRNVHVINELNLPLVVLGAKDMVVVATPDGILVSDKSASSFLKKYVPK